MSRDITTVRLGGMLSNRSDEKDVTVKVTAEDGTTRLVSGFYRDLGCVVEGYTLDPDDDFEMEFGRPEVELKLINYRGKVKHVRAWENSVKGPRTLFTYEFDEEVALLADESLTIVGPLY